MYQPNQAWAGQVLGMDINSLKGPDLICNDKIVEVKFNLVFPDRYSHKSWRVLEHQIDYDRHYKNKDAYWALGFYSLSCPVSQVQSKDPESLESLVTSRELYVVKWEWMNQFTSYTQTGKTKRSSWRNTLRFPKFTKLPKIETRINVPKGIVYLTKGVSINRFPSLLPQEIDV